MENDEYNYDAKKAEVVLDNLESTLDFIKEMGLKGHGNKLVMRCPFHKEKTGSFTVHTESRKYHCFGCGKNGELVPAGLRRELELMGSDYYKETIAEVASGLTGLTKVFFMNCVVKDMALPNITLSVNVNFPKEVVERLRGNIERAFSEHYKTKISLAIARGSLREARED